LLRTGPAPERRNHQKAPSRTAGLSRSWTDECHPRRTSNQCALAQGGSVMGAHKKHRSGRRPYKVVVRRLAIAPQIARTIIVPAQHAFTRKSLKVPQMGEAELHRGCQNSFRPLRAFSSLDLGRPRGWPLFCVIPVFDPRPHHRAGTLIERPQGLREQLLAQESRPGPCRSGRHRTKSLCAS
jgi:hypothetical protein